MIIGFEIPLLYISWNLLMVFTIWSKVRVKTSPNIISTIAEYLLSVKPFAKPTIADSEIGVEITFEFLFDKFLDILKAPPYGD